MLIHWENRPALALGAASSGCVPLVGPPGAGAFSADDDDDDDDDDGDDDDDDDDILAQEC